jgi:predicted nucleotidyltransferase
MKNQVEVISLVKEKIRMQSKELITTLREQADELEKKINERMDSEFCRYERELENFYREYDTVNNYLRENLLQIIDGEIDFTSFSRNNICKDIDAKAMPNFGKVKQVM